MPFTPPHDGQSQSRSSINIPGSMPDAVKAMKAKKNAAARDEAGSDSKGRVSFAEKGDGDAQAAGGGDDGHDEWMDEKSAAQLLLVEAPVPPPSEDILRANEEGIDEIMKRMEKDVATLDEKPLAHLEAFDDELPEQEVVITAVPVDQLEEQERVLEAERVEDAQKDMKVFMEREQDVIIKEQRARDRVLATQKTGRTKLHRTRVDMVRQQRHEEEQMRTRFSSAEETLRKSLERQEALVHERVGDLRVAKDTGRVGFRRVGVQWKSLPQLVEIRLHYMRAVRDRLPSGRFVVLATLFDRLGGRPLHWTSLGPSGGGDKHPGATAPIRHRGRFYDVKMDFNQSIYVMCPPHNKVRPSMVIVLELFMIGTKTAPVDRVVAWGALPVCDVNYDVVHGKYRLPFLKGNMGSQCDKYEYIEDTYSKDINKWLCNLYVDICHVPKSVLMDGQPLHEFDVKVDFTRTLLNLRGVKIPDDDDDLAAGASGTSLANALADKPQGVKGVTTGKAVPGGGGGKGKSGETKSSAAGSGGAVDVDKMDKNAPKARRAPIAGAKDFTELGDDFYFSVNRTSLTAAIAPNSSHGTHSETRRKLDFLKHELLADFGMKNWGNLEFWVMLFIIVFSSWLRMYVHYLGQWLFLQSFAVAVYDLRPMWYAILVKYNADALPVHVELGAVFAGQALNIIVFMLLMFVTWSWQKLLRVFPETGSRFVMGFGFR